MCYRLAGFYYKFYRAYSPIACKYYDADAKPPADDDGPPARRTRREIPRHAYARRRTTILAKAVVLPPKECWIE